MRQFLRRHVEAVMLDSRSAKEAARRLGVHVNNFYQIAQRLKITLPWGRLAR